MPIDYVSLQERKLRLRSWLMAAGQNITHVKPFRVARRQGRHNQLVQAGARSRHLGSWLPDRGILHARDTSTATICPNAIFLNRKQPFPHSRRHAPSFCVTPKARRRACASGWYLYKFTG